MTNEFKRIHGGFKNVPEHLLTKTRLAQQGLRPGGPAKAEYWIARQWAQLYDINEAVPKRVASEKQLAALAKGRATIEENSRCDVCRGSFHKTEILRFPDEKICRRCHKEREEEEYLKNSKEFSMTVAGSFYVKKSILNKMRADTVLKIEREPGNVHDQNAIRVMAFLDGQWEKIGYVPMYYSSVVSLRIDNGEFVGIKNLGIGTNAFERFDSYDFGGTISIESYTIVNILIFFEKEE